MTTRKDKELADFRRNVLRSPSNDGPDLAELQEKDFRTLQESRMEAAKKGKSSVDKKVEEEAEAKAAEEKKTVGTHTPQKKAATNDGNKSGSK